MTLYGNPERAALIAALLTKPDRFDAQRQHVLKQEGDPRRRETVLPRLLMAWAQHRHLSVDPEPIVTPAVRRLRMATRRTA